MESARHVQQMTLLIQSLEYAWKDHDDFYVGGNMFLYFSETQSRRNDFRGPDVFVVMNTDRRERKAWVVWEEGGKTPDVVIELLSDTTREIDRGEKMRIYSSMLKVGEYFLFDPFSAEFEGYELDATSATYRKKEPNARGNLESKHLKLELGTRRSMLHAVETNWLRWIDRDGSVLLTPAEAADRIEQRAEAEAQRAEAEAQRAEAEAQRAEAAQRRVEELEAELRALRGG